jgi:excisionase family DNA binding protein
MNMTFLTPETAAEKIGVSRSLIYQWIEEGRITHYRLGGRGKRGRIMIDQADLYRFLEQQKVEARSFS